MTKPAPQLDLAAETVSAEPAVVSPVPALVPSETAALPSVVTPMALIDRAISSGMGTETLEKLFALQERWEKNQGRKAFDEAMAAAKAEIPVIAKRREVDFTSQKGRTHYKYEDLAEIARTVDPILGKYGLSYRYRVSSELNQPVTVTCIVAHRAGHFEETTLSAGRDDSGNKNSIQQVGSTLTYLQRMTLKAALGLAAAHDDDGKASGDGGPVSDEQYTQLVTLADDVGADKQKFCSVMKVASFAEIPASRFDEAVKLLETKRKK